MTAIKISILCLYRRTFPIRTFRLATLIVGVICVAWFIGGTFATIFQCRPIAAAWDWGIPESEKRCVNIKAMFEGIVAINLITDVIILCLPMKLIWNLHLALRQKLVLLAIFSLGGLLVLVRSRPYLLTKTFHSACIICLLRIALFVKDQYNPDPSCKIIPW